MAYALEHEYGTSMYSKRGIIYEGLTVSVPVYHGRRRIISCLTDINLAIPPGSAGAAGRSVVAASAAGRRAESGAGRRPPPPRTDAPPRSGCRPSPAAPRPIVPPDKKKHA